MNENNRGKLFKLPLGILNAGIKKSPSPTPPLRLRASLTTEDMWFRIYSIFSTSTSAGTFLVIDVKAAFVALRTLVLSSLRRKISSLKKTDI